jgi:hypothetical protein
MFGFIKTMLKYFKMRATGKLFFRLVTFQYYERIEQKIKEERKKFTIVAPTKLKPSHFIFRQ